MQEHMNDVAAALKADLESAKRIYREGPKHTDGRTLGSTSYLQRKLQWTYNHAAAVVEALVAEGWLTEPDFRGRRFVLGK